jgi:hypothetical protein
MTSAISIPPASINLGQKEYFSYSLAINFLTGQEISFLTSNGTTCSNKNLVMPPVATKW